MTDAQRVMAAVDRMPKAVRELVHIYGFAIVHEMRLEGYRDANALRPVLETWRKRRQQEKLDQYEMF